MIFLFLMKIGNDAGDAQPCGAAKGERGPYAAARKSSAQLHGINGGDVG
jgi:hypothetical protein